MSYRDNYSSVNKGIEYYRFILANNASEDLSSYMDNVKKIDVDKFFSFSKNLKELRNIIINEQNGYQCKYVLTFRCFLTDDYNELLVLYRESYKLFAKDEVQFFDNFKKIASESLGNDTNKINLNTNQLKEVISKLNIIDNFLELFSNYFDSIFDEICVALNNLRIAKERFESCKNSVAYGKNKEELKSDYYWKKNNSDMLVCELAIDGLSSLALEFSSSAKDMRKINTNILLKKSNFEDYKNEIVRVNHDAKSKLDETTINKLITGLDYSAGNYNEEDKEGFYYEGSVETEDKTYYTSNLSNYGSTNSSTSTYDKAKSKYDSMYDSDTNLKDVDEQEATLNSTTVTETSDESGSTTKGVGLSSTESENDILEEKNDEEPEFDIKEDQCTDSNTDESGDIKEEAESKTVMDFDDSEEETEPETITDGDVLEEETDNSEFNHSEEVTTSDSDYTDDSDSTDSTAENCDENMEDESIDNSDEEKNEEESDKTEETYKTKESENSERKSDKNNELDSKKSTNNEDNSNFLNMKNGVFGLTDNKKVKIAAAGGGVLALAGGAVAFKFIKDKRKSKFNLQTENIYTEYDENTVQNSENTQFLGIKSEATENPFDIDYDDKTEYTNISEKNIRSEELINEEESIFSDGASLDEDSYIDYDFTHRTEVINEGEKENFKDYDITEKTVVIENNKDETEEISRNKVENNELDITVEEVVNLETKFDSIIKEHNTMSKREFAGMKSYNNGYTESIGYTVNSSTGNYMYFITDMVIEGGKPLEFTRFYNSIDVWQGNLGKKWHHNFEVKLQFKNDRVNIVFEDGKTETFSNSENSYNPIGNVNGILKNIEEKIIYKGSKISYIFSKEGLLEEIKRSDSDIIKLIYNNELLTKVYNSFGEINFVYSDGLLVRIYDQGEREVLFNHENDCLTKVTDIMKIITEYEYNKDGELINIFDSFGNIILQNDYDSEGKTLKQVIGDKINVFYKYDKTESTTYYIDKYGNEKRYIHDGMKRIVEVQDDNLSEKRVFNKDGNLSSFEDMNGNIYRFRYREKSIISLKDPLGNVYLYDYKDSYLYKVTNPDYTKYLVKYNEDYKVTKFIDESNICIEYRYNNYDLLKEICFSNNTSIRFSYDENGNLIEREDQNKNIEFFEYDKLNRMIIYRDSKDKMYKFEYNNRNKISKIVYPNESVESFYYDYRDCLIEKVCLNGTSINYKYDHLGNLTEKKDQRGRVISYEYSIGGDVSSIVYGDNMREEFRYDRKGNLIEYTDRLQNKIKYEYDNNKNLIKFISGDETRRYKYDFLNRLVEKICGDDTISYSYRFDGKITGIKYSNGKSINAGYDKAGRILSVNDSSNGSWKYEYNLIGLLKSIYDENDNMIDLEYDKACYLKRINYPDGSFELFEYDNNYNIVKIVNKEGKEKTIEYDVINRATKIKGFNSKEKNISYTKSNKISSIESEDFKNIYSYDSAGRLIKVEYSNKDDIDFDYESDEKSTSEELLKETEKDFIEYEINSPDIEYYLSIDKYLNVFDESELKAVNNKNNLLKELEIYRFSEMINNFYRCSVKSNLKNLSKISINNFKDIRSELKYKMKFI